MYHSEDYLASGIIRFLGYFLIHCSVDVNSVQLKMAVGEPGGSLEVHPAFRLASPRNL